MAGWCLAARKPLLRPQFIASPTHFPVANFEFPSPTYRAAPYPSTPFLVGSSDYFALTGFRNELTMLVPGIVS